MSCATDDWITKDGTHYGLGSFYWPNFGILIGDNAQETIQRGLFSFDISSISSTVVSATLRLYQGNYDGTPYDDTDLGPLVVDSANFGRIEATAAVFDNYLTQNIANTTNSSNGWKEFNVKDAVQADIDAGRSTSQFKVRFTNDTDGGSDDDLIYVEDSENKFLTGNTPQLVVTYQ